MLAYFPRVIAYNKSMDFIIATDEALTAILLRYAERLPMSLIEIGKLALAGPGKVTPAGIALARGEAPTGPPPRWPYYVILSYMAACEGERREAWREALPAAVAVELSMAAADLLDELTDDDPSTVAARYGMGQALNTANLMLVMAQQALLWSAEESGGERALAALGALQDMLVDAATGQHLDMLYDKMGVDEVSLEMSVRATELKAGTLVSGACRMGALMSGASPEIVELPARFGKEMGGIAQLTNDIQDVLPQVEGDSLPARKTDIRLRKRTLPIVFTLRDDSPEPNALQRAYRNPDEGLDEEDLSQAIMSAGGVQFAQLVIEVHRQNALQILEELEALRPGAREILGALLPMEDA